MDESEQRARHFPTGWRSHLTGPFAALVVLTLFYALMLASVRDKSLTMDEPGHAVAGYLYWKYNDYRVDPENGNLPQRIIALPFFFSGETLPYETMPAGPKSDSSLLGDAWFNRQGYDTSAMIMRGRTAAGLIAVALGVVVWLWARQLFGPVGGILSLLLYVLNPGVLANGALMTSDTAAALFFALSAWTIWATLERISVPRVIASTFAIGGLFLSKMSAVIIIPIALVMIIARLWDGRPLPIGSGRQLSGRRQQAAAIACTVLVHAMGTVAIVWCCYGFRFSAFSPNQPSPAQFKNPWAWALAQPDLATTLGALNLAPAQEAEAQHILNVGKLTGPEWTYSYLDSLEKIRVRVLTPAQRERLAELMGAPPVALTPRLIGWVRDRRLLPEAFLYGYAHVWRKAQSGQNFAFLNGEVNTSGWRYFFPYVFAVKTPIALCCIAGLALAGLMKRPRKLWRDATFGSTPDDLGRGGAMIPLIAVVAVYSIAAATSHMNLGHRHLLPLYPPLFILSGAATLWFPRSNRTSEGGALNRKTQTAVMFLVVVLAIETGARFPNFLAYFNGVISPDQAYRHLVDSSLDWGQDVPSVAKYLDRNPPGPSFLAYYGLARPSYYGIKSRLIGGFPGYDLRMGLHPFYFIGEEYASTIPDFLREHPDFDPNAFFPANVDGHPGRLLICRSSVHRLTAGTYIIGASALQPLYPRGGLEWSSGHEANYQRLRARVRPWLGDDYAAKSAAMASASIDEWNATFDEYYDFRFARLTAFLRRREPDDQINYSFLVYHLTDREVGLALDGPSP